MKTRSNNRWAVGTIIFTAIVFPAMLVFPAYKDCGYVCDYDGSRMGYRLWLGAFKGSRWTSVSPVEEFMRLKHPDVLKHRWSSYNETGRNIYGQVLYLERGHPGPAFQLPLEILEACYPQLSDAEKKHFYDQLRDPGTDVTVLMKTLRPELIAGGHTNVTVASKQDSRSGD